MFKRAAAIVLVLMMMLAAGPAAGAQTITIGNVLWDSSVAQTAIVQAIIEDELGYDVEVLEVDAGPMWTGTSTGDIDFFLPAQLPGTHQHYYEELWTKVENLGPNLHGARIGLVVPDYVDIDSIEELNSVRDKFQGRIIGIDPGAGIMTATEKAVEAYDLDFTIVDGSDSAMTATLQTAIRRGDWVVVTGWTPHWKFAEWDLKYLEDPKGVYGGSERLHTIAGLHLKDKAPDVHRFLKRIDWELADIDAVMLAIRQGVDPAEAARAWIEDNRDRVDTWVNF